MNSPFNTLQQVINANRKIGNHFFDASTMKFFNSIIHGDLVKGRYFITSEKNNRENTRRYTIRMANNNGSIDTIYKFQHFKTLAKAKRAIKDLPAHFYDAYECARSQWLISKHTPVTGMKFTDFAQVEPSNNKDGSYTTDSFTGTCSYIAEHYEALNISHVENLIKDISVLKNLKK